MPVKKISEMLNNLNKPTEEFTASEGEDDNGDRSADEIIEYAKPTQKPKIRKEKKKKIIVESESEHEEEHEEVKESESDESESDIEPEKLKKVKKPSQLKKYQKDKTVIKQSLLDIKSLVRLFKQDILKLCKTYKGVELYDDDMEDIVESHNHIKTTLLQRLYHIEEELNEDDVKLPKAVYTSLDKAFETSKARVNKLLEH